MNMRLGFITIWAVSFFFLLAALTTEASAQGSGCSYLVWADEFDINGAPSSDKWGYDLGGGVWGNNELQTTPVPVPIHGSKREIDYQGQQNEW
jgi:hypothetical protein